MNIVRPTNEYNYYSVNYSILEFRACDSVISPSTFLLDCARRMLHGANTE